MLNQMLTDLHEALLAGERYWLNNLQLTLARFRVLPADQRLLDNVLRQVDEIFIVLIFAPAEEPRHAFINALLEQPVVGDALLSNPEHSYHFKYGSKLSPTAIEGQIETITAPIPLLREINLVYVAQPTFDLQAYTSVLERYQDRADLALLVTSSPIALSEMEATLLAQLQAQPIKTAIVISTPEPPAEPPLVAALRGRPGPKIKFFIVGATAAPGVAELRQLLVTTFSLPTVIRYKLQQPLETAFSLIDKYRAVVDERLGLLDQDLETLTQTLKRLQEYITSMEQIFELRLEQVNEVVMGLEETCLIALEQLLHPTHIFDLLRVAEVEEEFVASVVADVPMQVQARLEETSEWIASSYLTPWQIINDRLLQRSQVTSNPLFERAGGNFDYNRKHILQTTYRDIDTAIHSYDEAQEAARILQMWQQALVAMLDDEEVPAVVDVKIVFEGVARQMLTHLTRIPPPLRPLLVPLRRRALRAHMHADFENIRVQLLETLTERFRQILDGYQHKIDASVAPYDRFVQEERNYLNKVYDDLNYIGAWFRQIESEIKNLNAESR